MMNRTIKLNETVKVNKAKVASSDITNVEDVVKEPSHYKHGSFEMIDEMIIVFGIEATIQFCRMNAWKYRARAPFKGKMEEDMNKANRYLEMAYDLAQIRQSNRFVEDDNKFIALLKRGEQSESR